MKMIEIEPHYFLTREWKKLNYKEIKENLLNSDKYIYMVTDDNLTRVTCNLINEIQNQFDKQAPIIKVKINNDDKFKLSKENKDLINKKNEAYKKMKTNKTNENE